ncbi:MAG: GAF domain-containing protein [Halobacteriales archaeon]
MTEVLWVGNCEDIPDGFAGSDVFSLRCVPSDRAVDGVPGMGEVDCVVYDPEGDTNEHFSAVIETLCGAYTELPCVLVGATDRNLDDVYVFDHVPKHEGWVDVLSDVVRSAVDGRSHLSYPLPEDEEERLTEVEVVERLNLHGAFDRISEIGRYCFDADICFVGVVEERRELLISCRGASVEELPREDSVCTYGILNEGVTVVKDILEDPRFEARDRLHELGMRFYAGAPIDIGDARVGSFCIMDAEPRDLGDDERRLLRKFGDEVAEKIDLLRGRR